MNYDRIWRIESHNGSGENRLHDIILNQMKFKVHETYKKIEKITNNFESSNDEDVGNKTYLNTNLVESVYEIKSHVYLSLSRHSYPL